MPDTSTSRVHFMYLFLLQDLQLANNYSWGAAVLATLYRNLDRATYAYQIEIGGCLLLLQSWAWDRIQCIAPRVETLTDDEAQEGLGFPLVRRWSRPNNAINIPTHALQLIRTIFDRLRVNEFIWTPYRQPQIRRLINVEVPIVVRAKVPLICYSIVEWHAVDRVLRQFGLRQYIPEDPPNLDEVHKIDMRGKSDTFWPRKHRKWINDWNNRHHHIVQGLEEHDHILHENSEYMQWYIRRTRRYISVQGSSSFEPYHLHQTHAEPPISPQEFPTYMPQYD